jgi:hypothetical protein
MAPTQKQARKIVWDAIDGSGRRIIDQVFPKEIRKKTVDAEMRIELINGSIWQVVGSDNYDSLVGANPCGLVFSEYSLGNPDAWTYLRPILVENGGWAIFPYTPRGINHGHELYEMSKNNPEWYCELLDVEATDVMTREQVDQEIAAGMSPDLADQEFFCSFLASTDYQLVSYDETLASAKREIPCEDKGAPTICGVDVARSLTGDSSRIATRVGNDARSVANVEIRTDDLEVLADACVHHFQQVNPDTVFIDITGVGGGLLDILKRRGYGTICIGVNFASEDPDKTRFANIRAGMYWRYREWIRNGGCITDENALHREICAQKYGQNKRDGRFQLMSKEKLAESSELGYSCDWSDSEALTHARPVARKDEKNLSDKRRHRSRAATSPMGQSLFF